MNYTKITSKITSDINDAIMRLYPDTNIPDVTVTVPTQLDKADFVMWLFVYQKFSIPLLM